MPERLVLCRHARAAELVGRRAALLAGLRRHLDARGLLEVDVPVLLPHAGQEPHLHPPCVELTGLPGPLWLQTSPELPLKRLLCAGLPALYALGPAFRGGREELSALHQPQFTLLEWYRPGTRIEDLVEDCRALGTAAAGALGVAVPAEGRVLPVAEAFGRWAGLELEPLLDGDVRRFVAGARARGLARADDDPETAFTRVLVECIEPALRREPGWTFLHAYPALAGALARASPSDPRVVQRVEAYLDGIELANGWVELSDPDEVRRRWRHEASVRQGPVPARDEQLLDDLGHGTLPPTVGMALGVDRLAMVLLGADTLRDVLPLALELTSEP